MIQDNRNHIEPVDNSEIAAQVSLPKWTGQPSHGASDSILFIMWRHGWIVLLGAIVGIVIGCIWIHKSTPIYESTSRIYVEQTGPKIMQELEEGFMTGSNNYLYTQAELTKATPILSDAIKKGGFQNLQTFNDVHNLVAYLKRNVTSVVGKKDDILRVSFKSPYPAEAAQITNAIVDSYVTFHATRKRSTSSEVLKILQQEKSKRSVELSQKLHTLTEFKKENEALAFQSDQSNILLDRMRMLSASLHEAELYALECESAFELAQQVQGDIHGIGQFSKLHHPSQGNPEDDILVQRWAELKAYQAKRTNHLREMTEDHPAILALDTEIERLQKEIKSQAEEVAQKRLKEIEQIYRVARIKKERLERDFQDQRNQVVALNGLMAQYMLLQSEYEQTKRLCDILDDRIRELNVTEDVGALNITILEVAQPSIEPSEPDKRRIMATSMFLGFMVGCGLAFLRNLADHRIRSIDEISQLTGATLLGTVPAMPKKLALSERGQKVLVDGQSSSAEAFRTIRTAIFFSIPQNEAQTIHITSSMAGEGKSTLASNIAIAMAQSGQRVLLIDADFRRPMLHKIFGLANDSGLSSVLARVDKPSHAIVHGPIEGLDILFCGPEAPNPAELLNSHIFKRFLDKLKHYYHRIIIDSPPLGPVADSAILSAICDVTILVVRSELARRRPLIQSSETLNKVGGRVLGCVVNDVQKHSRYGYYYGYGAYGKYYNSYNHDGGNGKRENGRKRRIYSEKTTFDKLVPQASKR